MTDNNYQAPQASLLDLPEPALPERPRNVNIALVLIGVGLLIRLLSILKTLQVSQFQVEEPARFALTGVDFALFGVILHQLARGKRWARVVLLVLMLVMFAQQCIVVGYVWRQSPDMWDSLLSTQSLLVRVLPMVMNFLALHLLYFSSGNWFRKT